MPSPNTVPSRSATCVQCAAGFRHFPSQKRRFCSIACYQAWWRANGRGAALAKNRSRRQYTPRIPMTCQQCGTIRLKCPSQVRIGRGRFCSRLCLGIWTTQHGGRRVSVPETEFFDALEASGIVVRRQHRIGPFVVDGYVPTWNKVIEIDGDYWHNLPAMKARDERKGAYLIEHGYSVSHVPVGREQSRPGRDWSKLVNAMIACYGRAVA